MPGCPLVPTASRCSTPSTMSCTRAKVLSQGGLGPDSPCIHGAAGKQGRPGPAEGRGVLSVCVSQWHILPVPCCSAVSSTGK